MESGWCYTSNLPTPDSPAERERSTKENQDVMGVGGERPSEEAALSFVAQGLPNPGVPNEAEPTTTVAEGGIRTQLSGSAPHSSASSGQPPECIRTLRNGSSYNQEVFKPVAARECRFM